MTRPVSHFFPYNASQATRIIGDHTQHHRGRPSIARTGGARLHTGHCHQHFLDLQVLMKWCPALALPAGGAPGPGHRAGLQLPEEPSVTGPGAARADMKSPQKASETSSCWGAGPAGHTLLRLSSPSSHTQGHLEPKPVAESKTLRSTPAILAPWEAGTRGE